MAELINLRQARKQKARAEKDKIADANRMAHGTPKAVRKLEQTRKDQAESRHSGHRLDTDSSDN